MHKPNKNYIKKQHQHDIYNIVKYSYRQSPCSNSRRIRMIAVSASNGYCNGSELLEPNYEDMKKIAFLLANISESIGTDPQLAFTSASAEIGWLLSRNIPKLTEMLLQEFPVIRNDELMQRSYLFLIDFVEAIVNETTSMLTKHRSTLRKIMEAAKVNELSVDKVIKDNKKEMLSPEFLVYLDSEIENQDMNSPNENFLITIKLRLLDEIGR